MQDKVKRAGVPGRGSTGRADRWASTAQCMPDHVLQPPRVSWRRRVRIACTDGLHSTKMNAEFPPSPPQLHRIMCCFGFSPYCSYMLLQASQIALLRSTAALAAGGCESTLGRPGKCDSEFMAELTAQVGVSKFSKKEDCKNLVRE